MKNIVNNLSELVKVAEKQKYNIAPDLLSVNVRFKNNKLDFISGTKYSCFIYSYPLSDNKKTYSGSENSLLDLFIEIAKEKVDNCFKINKQLIAYLKTIKEDDLAENNTKAVIKSMCLELENKIIDFDSIIPAEESLTNWNGFLESYNIYSIIEGLNVVKKIVGANYYYNKDWQIKTNQKFIYLKIKEDDFDISMISLNKQQSN